MDIYIWHANGGWFWDDAEDHGGFDRNVPCGPFPSRDNALVDAAAIARIGTATDGQPPRYSL